ncbi:MAG: TetR/AcrR family transcriptional regulator [Telmatospirillum sp.]|nr:TetR/AcrR family transcriptional regulator [Telmatospirillum sp.]
MMTENTTKSAGCPDAVVDAALFLAAERGWNGISLADIAAEAGVTLADMRVVAESKSAILKAFLARLDDSLWTGALPAADETPRDRLFDVVMRRFDVMQEQRAGVKAIFRGLLADPLLLLMSGPHLLKTSARMLEVSGISASGPAGALKVKGLTAIYLAVLRVWLSDDSPDMGRTMAALDRFLRGAESIAGLAWRVPGTARSAGADPGNNPA